MATVNKDFKIKSGLIVEGTTAKVNNFDILTKKQADQDYIVSLIGGTSTPINTPDTVVKRDANGDFAAGEITADLVGDVTGTVSSLSNHDTGDLSEGTNLYYTNARVKDVLTGSTQTNISITNIDGVLHIEAENGVADSTTDDLDEGTTNKYYTDARARLALSEGTGINYDNTTGAISADLGDFDTDDLVEGTNKYFSTSLVDNHLTGGDGINYSTGTISADVSGGLEITAGQIVVDRDTVDTWYDANGAAGDVASDLSAHENLTSGVHGVTGSVVGTTDAQDLSNKRIIDTLYFSDGVTVSEEGEIAVRAVSHDFDVQANQGDLNLKTIATGADVNITSDSGDIILNPDGAAYVGSVSAGNEIATNSYVDNAVAGLNWKQAVNLLYDAAIPTMSGSGATQLTVDGHDVLGDADSGYRLLLTGATNPGIYVYNSTGGSWTLTRSTDADAFEELVGAAVFVMEGTQYANTSWVQSNHYLSNFTGQTWTQFSGSGAVVAGTGITVDGLEVSIDRATVDTWYDASGSAASVGTDLSNHALDTSTHGVGEIVGTSESQTLTNKTIDAASNTLLNIDNSSLTNSSITVNGYSTNLGSSVTLDTDDVSEGATNEYFTQTRARQSLSSGTAINYDNATGVISVDATQLDTGDIGEGTNLYYTDERVKSVLTASSQTNISITEVGGVLTISAENGVDDSTTDDLDEGTNNHYFTDARAKTSAADLLTGATLSNITITGTGAGLTITAENGVADSDTDDLDEGTTNLYFTDARVTTAIANATHIAPQAIDITWVRREEATWTDATTAAKITCHSASTSEGSMKYLVRVTASVGGTRHSHVTEVLATVDGSNGVAVVEYGTIYTSAEPLATVTVEWNAGTSKYDLNVTTANNNSEVMVAATLMAALD